MEGGVGGAVARGGTAATLAVACAVELATALASSSGGLAVVSANAVLVAGAARCPLAVAESGLGTAVGSEPCNTPSFTAAMAPKPTKPPIAP